MTTRALPWSFALAVGLVWACGDDENPPPPGTSTPNRGGEAGGSASGAAGRSGSGGTNAGGGEAGGGSGGTGAQPQGGNAGSGGTSVVGGEGGEPSGGSGGSGGSGIPPCDSETDPGPPPEVTSLCDPEGGFGPTVDVPLLDGAARLVAVTPDELTIAWFADVMMATQFYVADRSTATEDFGTPEELPDRDYVAMSPDGLRLVGFDENSHFFELVRSGRGQPFGEPSEGDFSALNADAVASDIVFLGAVISPDDSELYYLAQRDTDDQPLRVSRRTGSESWGVGESLAACEFQTHGVLVRRPTGVSADGLTLFYDDAVRGRTRAAWRESPGGEFVWFADVGSQRDAQPNADCSRLYFTASGGPSYSQAE